jgi:transglutaminase-like putative cysteine protease
LDLRGIDQRHEPDPQFRAALHSRLAAIVNGTDLGSVTEAPDLAMIDLEPASEKREPTRHGLRIAKVILAVAAVVAIIVVATREVEVVAVNPLVDIQPELVNRGNIELFTVATDTPRYLALTALGQFNGTRWSTVPEETRPASGTLGEAPQDAALVTQRITIGKLGGPLAPAARTATSATWQGPTLLWANEAGALSVDGGLEPNYQYQVTSADNFPTPEQLRTATVDRAPDPIYYDLPRSLPSEVRDLAQDVTALATTPYDKARALQDFFHTQFEYSLTVRLGHSNDAMLNFLSIKKGYCEQFSGTFAAMARSIGLPTRVVVGFTAGELRADGLYHVAGRDAHAWDEVWFDDYGWILFDPTPGRGAPGAEQHIGAAAAQEAAPRL